MATFLVLILCAPLASGLNRHAKEAKVAVAALEAHGRSRHRIQKFQSRGKKTVQFSSQAMEYFHALEHASSKWPVLVPPGDIRKAHISKPASERHSSLLGMEASQAFRVSDAFQPSAEFQAAGESEGADRRLAETAVAGLPWGIGSPRTGDSLPNFHYSAMPFIDFPKEYEYSLESGDNIQSYSNAEQDIKLITQVFENVTNGFYLDTNSGEGETDSNTLLLELSGWRGLIMEPRTYEFARLWSKFRKAWLFLGCLSPHENATKIGFDRDGRIDMLSGHRIHAYNLVTFMSEMGGRSTVDFWDLHSGGYEAEILNETLLNSGKNIEFGIIMVRFDGRRTGRGWQEYVEARSKDETEELVFEILHNASFRYIGGLDAYWINNVEPRFGYKEALFANPRYFDKRGIPTPWKVKAAPPPNLTWPLNNQSWQGYETWDSGYPYDEEIDRVVEYFKKARAAAKEKEPAAKAHRVTSMKLL